MLITLDNISRLVDNIKTWVSNNFISKDTQEVKLFTMETQIIQIMVQ